MFTPFPGSNLRLTGMLLLLASAVCGCDATPRVSDRDLVFVSVEDASLAVQGQRRSALAAPTPGVWIDARRQDEYRKGHIPGAIHMPLERVREEHEPLREYSVLIVYGADHGGVRAEAVSKLLLELRHKDVRTLRGGLKAWQDAGNPVATMEESGRSPAGPRP